MREYIIGAGGGGGGKGGGGGGSSPVEQPDSLHSRDSVVVLDALCEGEIFGLVDGLKSVYLNDTPVQNANGSYNFINLQIGTSNGTQLGVSGSVIMQSVAADVRSEVVVSTRVMQATPVVRRIADINVNAVDVRVSTPRMVQGDNQGNQSATSIGFTIEINTNGGGYAVVVNDAFSGKTTSKYDRTYRLPLTGVGPWDIRLTRLSADSVTSLLQNELWFDALSAIISQRLSYPNTALVAMAADARAFQSIPKRSYDIKGLIVRVPSNYNPTTRVYTGLWNGTFSLAWTDNPAWCFYDLLTDARYGLGAYLPDTAVDKWGLYAIGQYCDALVANGFGGTEPRFTFNAYISTRAEAFTVINQLASAFRGMVYWANGTLNAVQDAPLDPSALFTRANVIDGAFNYAGASRKAMHTVALVQWNDPANAYQPAIEYVEDAASIALYGVIETQLAAAGCTSRGQAHRLGEWLLYSERTEQEVVTFKASMDSAYVRPGQIIKVQDAHRSGKRFGGRLAGTGSTVNSLTLDAPLTIESGKTYSMSVVMPDGTIGNATVTNAAGVAQVLTLSPALAVVPQPNALWVVTASDLSPTLWRVLAVAESAKNEYSITALAHNPTKFAAIELGSPLQNPNAISIPLTPAAPANIGLTEDLLLDYGVARSRLNIGWDAVQYASRYRVSWRPVPGNFTVLPDTSVTNSEVLDVPTGSVEVRIEAVNSLGMTGVASTATGVVLGQNKPPSNVSSISASINTDGSIDLAWPEITDLDRQDYGLCTGDSWADSVIYVSGNRYRVAAQAAGTYVWQIRARNTSGILSAQSARVTVDTVSGVSGSVTVKLDAFGNAVIAFTPLNDPQILAYELRYGATFETGTLVATTTGSSFTIPVLGSAGRIYWIRAKYAVGYSIAGFRIDFSGATMATPARPTWSVAEPDLVFTWAATAGAAQYLCLFEVGGVTSVKVVAAPGVRFPIPKYSAMLRLVAMATDGTLSPFMDEDINISGRYSYNEIVNVALPLTTGNYLNLAFTAANTVKRAGLLGNAPVAPYAENINDGDLYSFGYNLQNLAASSIQNVSASWFRNGFWREQAGYFESAVVDLGAILTGSLILNLSKTVTYVGDAPVSAYQQVNAEYLASSDVQALVDHKAFLTARFFVATDSPLSATWTEAANGDWITARYVKIVVEVAMASALTDITVTAGQITIDVPDISESGSTTGVTSAGKAITFAKAYHNVSVVVATARGAAKAYTGNVTPTGCILYVDAGSQQVDYFIKGY